MRDYNAVNEKGKKGKFVSVLLTEEDFDVLTRVAEKTKRGKSWHLRTALKDYFKKFSTGK